jgi:hypothetical protein
MKGHVRGYVRDNDEGVVSSYMQEWKESRMRCECDVMDNPKSM